MRNILFQAFLAITFLVNAEIVCVNPPSEVKDGTPFIGASEIYDVELEQDGKIIRPFIYSMDAQWKTNNCKTTAWITFDSDKPVLVRVKSLIDQGNKVKILPQSSNVRVQYIENVASFELENPGQYSVEFQSGIKIDHPLMIFFNQPENISENSKPNQLIKFEKGYHVLKERLVLKSGQQVYLADGAFVRGQIYAENSHDIRIFGRGILSGEDMKARSGHHMIEMVNCNSITVEGITIIHAPRFNVNLYGKNHHIENIKMLGWWFSTDGVQVGEKSIVENCFAKVNDDAFKLYHSKTVFQNCVIWQMENGMPFQLGWSVSGNVDDVIVRNCNIIRVEHEWDNENEACFGAIHGAKGNLRNFLFENINIDNSNWRIFHIVTKPNRWAKWNTEKGEISNLVFRNIEFKGSQVIPSLIKGWDVKHQVYNITFKKFLIHGKKITNTKNK